MWNIVAHSFYLLIIVPRDRDSSVGIATRYLVASSWHSTLFHVRWCSPTRVSWNTGRPLGQKDSGSNPGGGEIFRTCPDRPCGPPSLLYNGYRVFVGGKAGPGCGVDHPPTSSVEVEERVDLYLYSTSRHSCPVIGFNLTVTLTLPSFDTAERSFLCVERPVSKRFVCGKTCQ